MENQGIFQIILLSVMSVYPAENYTDEIIQSLSHNQNIDSAIKKIEYLEKLEKGKLAMDEPMHSNRFVRWVNSVVENIYFQVVISIITLFSLFMEDIRIIFFDKTYDEEIDAVHLASIAIFMIQILMSLTIPGYFCSFFFYLDVFSTLSIAMDVSLITNLLYSSNQSGLQLSMIIRNSKASRAAARAVRVMKIFRLARIVKLYKSALQTKQFQEKKNKQKIEKKIQSLKLKKKSELGKQESQSAFHNWKSQKLQDRQSRDEVKNENVLSVKKQEIEDVGQSFQSSNQIKEVMDDQLKIRQGQSKISRVLSDSTIKKVIILILLLMFSVPIFSLQNYYEETNAWNFLIDFIGAGLLRPQISISKLNNLVISHLEAIKNFQVYDDIIVFQSPFNQLYSLETTDLNTLRITEIQIYEKQLQIDKIMEKRPYLTLSSKNLTSVSMIINYREFNKIDAWFSIGKTIAICVAIVYLLSAFNGSITRLIIDPIEKILESISSKKQQNSSQDNPTKETKQHEQIQTKQKNDKALNETNYQTEMIHNSIQKISHLIQKVYNQSGREAIYSKIGEKGCFEDTYLSDSKRQYCIFGLCVLENNYELSVLLENQYFQLMSQIAEYLHSAVYRYGGYAVSNTSKGLLVAFKYPKSFNTDSPTQKQQKIFADFALFSMVKTIVKINKENKFNKYRKNNKIMKRFQNLQIKVNCFLHSGWAYEGFYGSPYKLDYCFVGGVLKELEKIGYFGHKTANNVYMSDSVYERLTDSAKKFIRIVAEIQLSEDPKNSQISKKIEVYRVDLNINNISPSKSIYNHSHLQQKASLSLKKQINMEYLKNPKQLEEYDAIMFMNSKKELREVLKNVITQEYRRKYHAAYDHYVKGQLAESREIVEELMSFHRDDTLLQWFFTILESKIAMPIHYKQILIL